MSLIERICDSGVASRDKIWAILSGDERSTFKALLKPIASPESIAPPEQQPVPESIAPTVEATPESIAPPTVSAVKKRREFKVGGRVIVEAPDNKAYRGAVGGIVVTFDDEHGEQICRVKLDKRVRGNAFSEFPASQLMPEPIARPASEELPKKP
ncbi:hypothetical protein K4039_14655 [Lyngbya sp. CCAP 1446/10]|nr:hypothetical protein [Lyngbya sp. CCAP 1446/10]